MKVSVVSPVYKAEGMVEELVNRITAECEKLGCEYEVILVEDGSPDGSWQEIEEVCKLNSRIKGVKLSRNFGQHYAVTAGISKASGDFNVLMDCDLQDDPSYIGTLLKTALEGDFQIVFTKRKSRKHSFFKSLGSSLYNSLFIIFSDKRYDVNAGSLILFSKQVANEFLRIKDQDRLYLQIFKWLGFPNATIEVEHQPRFQGKSNYSFLKLLKIGLQGWTSHSDKLLRISIYLGFGMALSSLLISIGILLLAFFGVFQPGWPSLIVAIFFSTGLILLSIGIAGIYIGKTFAQSKARPLFIVEKEMNNE